MAAAFQRRQIAGAVTSNLRVDAPMRMLVDLDEMDIQYSNVVIAVSRDFYRRSPETVEALVRAYAEGVAVAHDQKERALKTIAKYTRLKDPKLIEELYKDADKFLDEDRGRTRSDCAHRGIYGQETNPPRNHRR